VVREIDDPHGGNPPARRRSVASATFVYGASTGVGAGSRRGAGLGFALEALYRSAEAGAAVAVVG
jgi:hypothetical protein